MALLLTTTIDEYLKVLKCNRTGGPFYVVLQPHKCVGRLHNVVIHQLAILNRPRDGLSAYDYTLFRKTYKSPTGLIIPCTDDDTVCVDL